MRKLLVSFEIYLYIIAIAKVFSTLRKNLCHPFGVGLCSFDYSYNNVIPSGLLFTGTPTCEMTVVEKDTITSQSDKLYR